MITPVGQGGLEIPVEDTVRTKYCSSNKEAVGKYEDIINKQYKELEDGKFEDVTKEILEDLQSDSDTDEDEAKP